MGKKRKKLINYLIREQGYSDQAAEREAEERLRKKAREKGGQGQDGYYGPRRPFDPDYGI